MRVACFLQGRGRLMSKLADLMEAHLSEPALLESLDAGTAPCY
jgi:acyl-CoA reductase-like NAD-dependent aldehyde dehydrogenase